MASSSDSTSVLLAGWSGESKILFPLSPPALKAFLISKKVSITFSFALKNKYEKLLGFRNVVGIIDKILLEFA